MTETNDCLPEQDEQMEFISDLQKFYIEYAKRYRGRIGEFDPNMREELCFHMSMSTYNKYRQKRRIPDRISVFRVENPVFCSPSFLDQCATELQQQMEKAIGFEHIHRMDPQGNDYLTVIIVFASKEFSKTECRFYYKEKHDGICYLYFLTTLIFFSKDYYVDSPSLDVWARVSSLTDPSDYVDPEKEFAPGEIKFEICDKLPDSLPPKNQLPEFLCEAAESRATVQKKEELRERYWKRFYDPNSWIEPLKQYISMIDKRVKRRQKRLAGKKKAVAASKAEIKWGPEDSGSYPDVIFRIEFNEEIPDEKVTELDDSVSGFNGDMKTHDLEFYTVEKTGDRTCEITVDFGMCHPSAVMRLVKAICMDVAGIKTITID